MLDVFLVALPSLDRTLRLVNAPQIDESALSSDSDIFAILPFNFEATEIWIDVAMIETSSFPARIRFAIPNVDSTEESASRY